MSSQVPLKDFADEVAEQWQHNVTDEAVEKFRTHYKKDDRITHDDIFDYVVAMLDCPAYLEKYEESLRKATNIPYAPDFWDFVKAGQQMSYLHLNYERLPKYPLKEKWMPEGDKNNPDHWKFGKEYNTKSKKVDMWFMDSESPTPATLAVNDFLYLDEIPKEAYEYTIAGRHCIWWVKNRYTVKTDKDSKITNDANDLFEEPQDFVELVKSVITFSVAMNRVRTGMPKKVTGSPKKGNLTSEEDAISELESILDEIIS